MNALDAELVLDRLEARLASELPGHIAGSAQAYARGTNGPAAIEIAHRELAAVLAARSFDGNAGSHHHELRARSTRLLRVIAPMVIESAPSVIAARALERTWATWRTLVDAREAQSQARFGVSHRALVHVLAGVSVTATSAKSNAGVSQAETSAKSDAGVSVTATSAKSAVSGAETSAKSGGAVSSALPDVSGGGTRSTREDDGSRGDDSASGWRTSDAREGDGPVRDGAGRSDGAVRSDGAIRSVWGCLRNDASLGELSIIRSASAHPRTFVVERGVRAIIVVPERIDTPAARFAVLHELGHALLWLAPISRQHEWPRAIDEAAASYVARAMELDRANDASHANDDAIAGWRSPLARAARKRRLGIARMLDAIESSAEPGDTTSAPADIPRPPWALWNDPHAQAAYIEAERIADEMPAGLRGSALAECLASRSSAIDAGGW